MTSYKRRISALIIFGIMLLQSNTIFAQRLRFEMHEFYTSDKESQQAIHDLFASAQPMDNATYRMCGEKDRDERSDIKVIERRKTRHEITREAIEDEEEALYKTNERNRMIAVRETEKIADKDLQVILKIHFSATHDYSAEVAWIDEYLKKPESAAQIKETIKSTVFSSIKTIPFPEYLNAIDDEKLKTSATSLYQLFCDIRNDVIETPGWRVHQKDWKALEFEFETTITTTGIPELKLPLLRDIRCRLVRLYSWRISEINYLYYDVKICRENRLALILNTPAEREKERIYIVASISKYEADAKRLISSGLLLKSDIQLVETLNASVNGMAKKPGFFAIEEYYDFLQSYTCVPETDLKLSPETNTFIKAFDDAWFKNGWLTLKVQSALDRCQSDMTRRTRTYKQ